MLLPFVRAEEALDLASNSTLDGVFTALNFRCVTASVTRISSALLPRTVVATEFRECLHVATGRGAKGDERVNVSVGSIVPSPKDAQILTFGELSPMPRARLRRAAGAHKSEEAPKCGET
jgi:hypothetical protein